MARKEQTPMEHQTNKPLPVELSSQLVTIMTTEHYTLQTGRSMTISEANGRALLFVGAVSSGLIALAFVGQISRFATPFLVFSLVVLPTLFLMGLITFERVRQSGMVDILYARGINRIRHLYLEYAPQMQPYFILSAHDDREGILGKEAMHTSWVQVFFSAASMIAVINSVLVGSFVGLLCAVFTLPLAVTTSMGVLTFLLSGALHQHYQWRQLRHRERDLPALFPSQPRK
jgi:hypothetical protein